MSEQVMDDYGYEMPDLSAIPDSIADPNERYVHPLGNYVGVLSVPSIKYRDPQGQKCKSDAPGARPAFIYLPVWLISYNSIPILGEKLEMRKETHKLDEVYFPLILSFEPKDQWKNIKILESLVHPKNTALSLIGRDKNNPGKKIFQPKLLFKEFIGVQISFNLVASEKGSRYINDKILTHHNVVYPIADIVKIQREWEEWNEAEYANRRNSSADTGYTPPPEPTYAPEDIF